MHLKTLKMYFKFYSYFFVFLILFVVVVKAYCSVIQFLLLFNCFCRTSALENCLLFY